ncbi:hypothetical protein [Fervidicola ferrireducens]|nr:hypothetical protein [Fervidicola ferrireducens]
MGHKVTANNTHGRLLARAFNPGLGYFYSALTIGGPQQADFPPSSAEYL